MSNFKDALNPKKNHKIKPMAKNDEIFTLKRRTNLLKHIKQMVKAIKTIDRKDKKLINKKKPFSNNDKVLVIFSELIDSN